jgi:hypothetical protein
MVIVYLLLNVALGVLGRREWQMVVACSGVPVEEERAGKIKPSGIALP